MTDLHKFSELMSSELRWSTNPALLPGTETDYTCLLVPLDQLGAVLEFGIGASRLIGRRRFKVGDAKWQSEPSASPDAEIFEAELDIYLTWREEMSTRDIEETDGTCDSGWPIGKLDPRPTRIRTFRVEYSLVAYPRERLDVLLRSSIGIIHLGWMVGLDKADDGILPLAQAHPLGCAYETCRTEIKNKGCKRKAEARTRKGIKRCKKESGVMVCKEEIEGKASAVSVSTRGGIEGDIKVVRNRRGEIPRKRKIIKYGK